MADVPIRVQLTREVQCASEVVRGVCETVVACLRALVAWATWGEIGEDGVRVLRT